MLNIFKKSYWAANEVKLPNITVSYNTQLLRTHDALNVLQKYHAKMPGFRNSTPEEITEIFNKTLLKHEDDITLERIAKRDGDKLDIGEEYEFQPNIYKADSHQYLILLSTAVFDMGLTIKGNVNNNLNERFEGVDLTQFNPNLVTILEPLEENEIDPDLDAEQNILVKKYFQENIQSKLVSRDEAKEVMIRSYMI